MSVDFITQLIVQYRYWILIPLTIIEGPIVAFVAGALAALGYFNIYFLIALFFVRDVVLDSMYYAIGYFGGRTTFVGRMLKKIGVTSDRLEEMRVLWERRPGTTMFIGKFAYGIAAAFIVVTGAVKMSLSKFFKYGIIVGILQYGILLFAGYFLGTSFGGDIVKIINNVQYILAFMAVVIVGYYALSWRMRNKLLKNDQGIEDALERMSL